MNHLLKKGSLFLLILFVNCTAQEPQNVIEITYKAQTRGSFFQIVYNGNKIVYTKNSEEKTIFITAKEMKLINEIVSNINLTNIKNLKAPSNNSSKDAAMIASFEFNNGRETFISSNFDHENPPLELKALYQKLKVLLQ